MVDEPGVREEGDLPPGVAHAAGTGRRPRDTCRSRSSSPPASRNAAVPHHHGRPVDPVDPPDALAARHVPGRPLEREHRQRNPARRREAKGRGLDAAVGKAQPRARPRRRAGFWSRNHFRRSISLGVEPGVVVQDEGVAGPSARAQDERCGWRRTRAAGRPEELDAGGRPRAAPATRCRRRSSRASSSARRPGGARHASSSRPSPPATIETVTSGTAREDTDDRRVCDTGHIADCLFCRIVAGELPSTRVHEDDRVIAIMDIFPATRGHALVIPRAHAADIRDGRGGRPGRRRARPPSAWPAGRTSGWEPTA